LDLKYLTPAEKREIKSQIEFYKKHRRTLQYGRFDRLPAQKANKVHWQCTERNAEQALAGFFQTQTGASESYDFLPLTALDPDAFYSLETRPRSLSIKRFGGLVKHILPITLDPDGLILRTANRHHSLIDCVEAYRGFGDMFMSGVRLNNQFVGTYYNNSTRLLGDFGSNLYVVTKQTEQSRGAIS
jgi:alpha-galactosidase